MKVIIAGTRKFDDYKLLQRTCDKILSSQSNIEIVSGTANGADKLGEAYAIENGYHVKRFPADWDRYGKSAGYIRKLTPIECERLQTLPDNYTEGVSNSQRYKMLGNGWTVDVISHIFKGLKNNE